MGEQHTAGPRGGTPEARVSKDAVAPRPRVIAALAVLTVLVLGFLAFRSVSSSGGPAHLDEADAYLAAWQEGDLASMAAAVAEPPAEFTAQHQQMLAGL